MKKIYYFIEQVDFTCKAHIIFIGLYDIYSKNVLVFTKYNLTHVKLKY